LVFSEGLDLGRAILEVVPDGAFLLLPYALNDMVSTLVGCRAIGKLERRIKRVVCARTREASALAGYLRAASRPVNLSHPVQRTKGRLV
jgi:hypothetical protein